MAEAPSSDGTLGNSAAAVSRLHHVGRNEPWSGPLRVLRGRRVDAPALSEVRVVDVLVGQIALPLERLVRFAQNLNAEERRGVAEGLSEEELALFDLLTKPDPALYSSIICWNFSA